MAGGSDETLTDVAVVRADNIAAGRTMGAHLAELGHTRVAFAGGPRVSVECAIAFAGCAGAREAGVQMRKQDAAFAPVRSRGRRRVRGDVPAAIDASNAVVRGRRVGHRFIRAAQQRGVHVPTICRSRRSTGIQEERVVAGPDDDAPAACWRWDVMPAVVCYGDYRGEEGRPCSSTRCRWSCARARVRRAPVPAHQGGPCHRFDSVSVVVKGAILGTGSRKVTGGVALAAVAWLEWKPVPASGSSVGRRQARSSATGRCRKRFDVNVDSRRIAPLGHGHRGVAGSHLEWLSVWDLGCRHV